MSDGSANAAAGNGAFDHECFFITPIGEEDSPERKRSDGLLQAVIEPCAKELGLETVRADKIEEGGHITLQVLDHCLNAKAAVADLTGGNLNVYYEVGLRHALRQPVVLLADDAARGSLPFDLLQQRTIFYTDDMAGVAAARRAVTEQLRRALDGHIDSPVQAAVNLRAFEQGDAVERTLADLVTKVEQLPQRLSRLTGPTVSPRTIRDLLDGISRLTELAGGGGNAEVSEVLRELEPAVTDLVRSTISDLLRTGNPEDGLENEDPSQLWRRLRDRWREEAVPG
jgi:hypothetical protein